MSSSNLVPNRLWRRSLQVVLALGATACGATVAHGPQPPGVAEMQGRNEPATFRFWAPPATRFVWTERRSFDVALANASLTDHDVSELRWDVSMRPATNGATVIDQRLVGASFVHDGSPVLSGAPDALIQLVVDSEGTLQDVRGVDDASRAVRALATPGMEALANRMFSPQALDALVRARAQLTLGQVVGRPTGEGQTWIVPQQPGDNALFTRYTVGGTQPCDASPQGQPTECTQLRVWIDVRPSAAAALAGSLVEMATRQPAQEIAPPAGAKPARYVMWGNLLVQPATLLPAGAALREAGHLDLLSGGKAYRVDLRALTEDRYEYGTSRVAAR